MAEHYESTRVELAMKNAEHELDAEGVRTGRTRPTQFMPTFRYAAVPPSKRVAMGFS